MYELSATADELTASWVNEHGTHRAYLADRPGVGTFLITTIDQTPDGTPGNGYDAVAEIIARAPRVDDWERWGDHMVANGFAVYAPAEGDRLVSIDGEAYVVDYAEDIVLTTVEWPEVSQYEKAMRERGEWVDEATDGAAADDIGTLHDATIEPDAERDALNAVREALTATLGAVLDVEDLDDVAPRLLAALRGELGGYLIDPAIVGLAYVNTDADMNATREVYLNLTDPMADNMRFQSYDGAQWTALQ